MTNQAGANPRSGLWSNWMLVPIIIAVICLTVLGCGFCMWSYLFVSIFPWPSMAPGTPLPAISAAALAGDVEAIEAELQAGVQVDLPTASMGSWVDGATPLMLAAYGGHIDAVEHLIDAGADLMATDASGGTPLHWAVYTNWNGIPVLIDAGADVDAQDTYGRTPLMRAAVYGTVEHVTELIEAGADLHAVDNQGRTALDLVRQLAPRTRAIIQVLEAAMQDEADR